MVFCFKVVVVGLDLCCEGFEAAAFLILDEEPDCEGFVERLFAPLEAPDLILVVIAPVVHCFLLSSQKVSSTKDLSLKHARKVQDVGIKFLLPPSSMLRRRHPSSASQSKAALSLHNLDDTQLFHRKRKDRSDIDHTILVSRGTPCRTIDSSASRSRNG